MANLSKRIISGSQIQCGLLVLGLLALFSGPTFAAQQTRINDERIRAAQIVGNYFNNLRSLKGTFIQTSSKKQKTRGRFYLQRPGKLSFEYKRPSRLRIVADGKWFAIEDPDTDTFDRFQLKSTPFQMLLRQDVDLLRDAQILNHNISKNAVAITVVDRSNKTGVKIKLVLKKTPQLQLKEWIVTDELGLETHIQVANLKLGETVNPKLFRISPMKFPESSY